MIFEDVITVPLKMDQLKKILETRSASELMEAEIATDPIGVVDYSKSNLKGDSFITYLANLKLNISIKCDGMEEDQKHNLLESYMKAKHMTSVIELNDLVGVILLEQKGIETDDSDLIMNKNERDNFANKHKDTIDKWINFLDSLVYALPFSVTEYANTVGKELIEKGEIETVNDRSAVGVNIAYLTLIPGFLEHYLSVPIQSKPKLYEVQLFEPMFGGFNFISVLSSNDSTLYQFMIGLFEGWFDTEQVKELKQEYDRPETN